jgi:hypothetical protein
MQNLICAMKIKTFAIWADYKNTFRMSENKYTCIIFFYTVWNNVNFIYWTNDHLETSCNTLNLNTNVTINYIIFEYL